MRLANFAGGFAIGFAIGFASSFAPHTTALSGIPERAFYLIGEVARLAEACLVGVLVGRTGCMPGRN